MIIIDAVREDRSREVGGNVPGDTLQSSRISMSCQCGTDMCGINNDMTYLNK